MYNDDFSKIYDLMGWDRFSHDIYNDLEKELKEGDSVLDVACGTGVLGDLFHKDGYIVTAFDKSPAMIKEAKKRNKKINFFVDDMLTFSLNQKFDLITCLYDSVNHIKNWKTFFKRVYKHLKDGGVFVFDFNTIKGLKNWDNTYVSDDGKGVLIFSGEFNKKKLSADLTIRCFLKGKGSKYSYIKDEFRSYAFPVNQVKAWLKESGFKFKYFYPKKDDPRRIFFICKKRKK